ncbi:MAG: cysteine hydrolase, partial [Ramlibacter sp.]|nr:cysteine hydrolase [Ramlibacter sp.]
VEGVSQLAAPALPVAGAHGDMLRLAKLIDESAAGISGITVTLDSHHRYDIAHPTFWTMRDGTAVSPFTTIIASQVRAGDFAPRDALALPRALAYLDELEHQGRYRLMVWPVHCEIGSWGHNVHAAVKAAYNRWEDSRLRVVEKVTKGSNPWTEHYSAMQAEVPDAADPATQMNRPLIARLDRADLVVIAGEASSHCVRATTEHLADNLPSGRIDKLVLLADCMSPVSGFETQADAFIETMRQRGAAVTDSISFAATLAANA